MSRFRKGDKVRFLGKEACEKSRYSSADYICGDLDGVINYVVSDNRMHLGIDMVVLEDDYTKLMYPEDVFELVQEYEVGIDPYMDPMIEYDLHDRQVVDALNDMKCEGCSECRDDVEDGETLDSADDVYGFVSDIDYANLRVIYEKDYDFYVHLSDLIRYLASTYSDKYETDSGNISSKDILMSKEGKAANMFTATKYLQRYNTTGFNKSENPQDLYKACHYIVFELQRKSRHDDK